MPSISVEGEVSELVADPELVETLEQCVINWLGQISYAVDSQLKKKPQVGRAGLASPPLFGCYQIAVWSDGAYPVLVTVLLLGRRLQRL